LKAKQALSVSKNTQSEQRLHIVLIEPNEPDARWFEMLLNESPFVAVMTRYATDVAALDVWTRLGRATKIDLIVMADILPMLTTQEFVDSATAIYPGVRIVVAREYLGDDTLLPSPSGLPWLNKPLSAEDIERLLPPVTFSSERDIYEAA
jgi:hypothetical protein